MAINPAIKVAFDSIAKGSAAHHLDPREKEAGQTAGARQSAVEKHPGQLQLEASMFRSEEIASGYWLVIGAKELGIFL